MDSLDQIIERFVNWKGSGNSGIEHYSGEEFLEILEKMLKEEYQLKKDAEVHGVNSEGRIHRYVINQILEPLVGKMKYGKRI